MQAVDAGRPLRGRMPQQRGAVVLQIRRQLDLQRVLDLGWLQERPQQRGGREVGDRERLADEIRAALPLLLDAVERGCDGGAILLQVRLADLVAEAVERRENPQQRPQRPVGLARACPSSARAARCPDRAGTAA